MSEFGGGDARIGGGVLELGGKGCHNLWGGAIVSGGVSRIGGGLVLELVSQCGGFEPPKPNEKIQTSNIRSILSISLP